MGDTLEKKQNHIVYLDLLRLLATLAVIVIHTCAQGLNDVSVRTFNWDCSNIYAGLSRCAVPVFVMISGSLFIGRDISIKMLYKKYILRIATAFSFWSVVYFVFGKLIGDENARVRSIPEGHVHLWFLFMIAALYMIVPLLHKLSESKQLIKYFIVLSFVFAILIPQFQNSIKYINFSVHSTFTNCLNNMNMHFVVGYVFYFMLGYYISKKEINKRTRMIIYSLSIAGFLATSVLSLVLTHNETDLGSTLHGNMTVNVMLEALGLFVFFKYNLNFNISDKARSVISKLSKYSFGAYLIHMIFIEALDHYFAINFMSFNPIISIPLLSISVFLLSFAFSCILNRIPIVKKYLV